MTPVRTRIENLDGLRAFAASFVASLPERAIILLHGPMGVGKTQFTKFVLETLGSTEAVSPSFSLHNAYETERGTVDHLDLYRLENADDLESTGFWDLFDSSARIVMIEWSERLNEFGLMSSLPQSSPKSWQKISLTLSFEEGSQASRIAVTERS